VWDGHAWAGPGRYQPEEAQLVDTATEVIWSYDVHWEPSDVRWASRWDIYLSMNGMYSDDIHWFSVSNAILIVLFLSALIGVRKPDRRAAERLDFLFFSTNNVVTLHGAMRVHR
jgi:hypothetical protein